MEATRVLVIGYGNSLRGDDGVGLAVAAQFERRMINQPVDVLIVHQLTPELAQPISKAGLVIFIDAAVGDKPGEVYSLPILPIEPDAQGFTHHVTPAVLLTYAQVLFGRCPAATMVSITGQSFDFSEHLSPVVAGAVDTAVAVVAEYIDAFRVSSKNND